MQYCAVYHETLSLKVKYWAPRGCAGRWDATPRVTPYTTRVRHSRLAVNLVAINTCLLTHRGRKQVWRRSRCRRWSPTACTGSGSAAGSPRACGASGASRFPARLRRRVRRSAATTLPRSVTVTCLAVVVFLDFRFENVWLLIHDPSVLFLFFYNLSYRGLIWFLYHLEFISNSWRVIKRKKRKKLEYCVVLLGGCILIAAVWLSSCNTTIIVNHFYVTSLTN